MLRYVKLYVKYGGLMDNLTKYIEDNNLDDEDASVKRFTYYIWKMTNPRVYDDGEDEEKTSAMVNDILINRSLASWAHYQCQYEMPYITNNYDILDKWARAKTFSYYTPYLKEQEKEFLKEWGHCDIEIFFNQSFPEQHKDAPREPMLDFLFNTKMFHIEECPMLSMITECNNTKLRKWLVKHFFKSMGGQDGVIQKNLDLALAQLKGE